MLTKAKKSIALFIAAVMLFTLAACSINSPGTKEYVDEVSSQMLEAVNLTRKLKRQQDELDIRIQKDESEITKTLEGLDAVYTKLLKLDAPSRYEDLNSELRTSAEAALGYINELTSLVKTAGKTGDDSLYIQEGMHIMSDYEVSYNELVDINSRITTKYRND